MRRRWSIRPEYAETVVDLPRRAPERGRSATCSPACHDGRSTTVWLWMETVVDAAGSRRPERPGIRRSWRTPITSQCFTCKFTDSRNHEAARLNMRTTDRSSAGADDRDYAFL